MKCKRCGTECGCEKPAWLVRLEQMSPDQMRLQLKFIGHSLEDISDQTNAGAPRDLARRVDIVTTRLKVVNGLLDDLGIPRGYTSKKYSDKEGRYIEMTPAERLRKLLDTPVGKLRRSGQKINPAPGAVTYCSRCRSSNLMWVQENNEWYLKDETGAYHFCKDGEL